MTQKISFSIENAEMINENPDSSFAVMSLDFFASGKNLHDMYVSEETLMKTAETIKNCPLVWKYDEELDDVYTHTPDEVPCGFVPEQTTITSRVLDDGRTMLSVVAYVWKRYTGELLNFFKRDGGVKPVSVEMSVLDTQERPDGLLELLDYRFEGITVLGTFVTPAIPLAKATVLSFSQEYEQVLKKEFSDDSERIHYQKKEKNTEPDSSPKDINPAFKGKNGRWENIDFKIPETVKDNAKHGLNLRKQYGRGGNNIAISSARYLANNDTITPEKIRQIAKYFPLHKQDNFSLNDPTSNENIAWLLWGGDSASKWSKSIIDKMDKEDETKRNFAIDDIKSEKEESNMLEEKEVKEEKMEAPMPSAAMAEVEVEIEDKEEKPEDEKKEEEMAAPSQFAFPNNFNMETMMSMFADKETEEIKYAVDELMRGQFADPSIVMSGMFAKMCKMSEMIQKMAKDAEVYMAENESLKQFKADMEENRKMFEVESTLKQLAEKVAIPEEAKKEMLAEATKYSFANIESWKTYCKAKSFDFSVVKQNEESNVVRVGMPFSGTAQKREDLWS